MAGIICQVRGAITLAGVLSIPLFLPDGTPFLARYQMVFIAARVIIFSLFMGVVSLPFLLKGMHVGDKQADANEIRAAKAAMAEVAIVSIGKMEERLSASSDEALDAEAISEVASRVAGISGGVLPVMMRWNIISRWKIWNAVSV